METLDFTGHRAGSAKPNGTIVGAEGMMRTEKFHAEWTADRRGRVKGDPIAPGLDFAAPPEFQGIPGVWSPEHCFVAAVATCFITTFRAIAEFSKFKFDGLTVTGEGVLEKGEGGSKFTSIFLQQCSQSSAKKIASGLSGSFRRRSAHVSSRAQSIPKSCCSRG